MVSGGDFPRKTPKSAAWRSNRIQVFGPGAHSGPKWRQGAPEYQENDSKTKHSGLPIFHFSRNSCGNLHNCICFWYFWSPFSRISCTLENLSIPIEQEGADLGDFRDLFRAPKTTNKQLRLCRYSQMFFKCTRKSRKWPKSAFSCSTAFRGIPRFPTSRPRRHPYIEIP